METILSPVKSGLIIQILRKSRHSAIFCRSHFQNNLTSFPAVFANVYPRPYKYSVALFPHNKNILEKSTDSLRGVSS